MTDRLEAAQTCPPSMMKAAIEYALSIVRDTEKFGRRVPIETYGMARALLSAAKDEPRPSSAEALEAAMTGKRHVLKTWINPFQAMWDGRKLFELRKNDRDFQVGDVLELHEYDPVTTNYSGRKLDVIVTFLLLGGQFGLPSDLCVMSVAPERDAPRGGQADIVVRLRYEIIQESTTEKRLDEAADEIERLRAGLERAAKALKWAYDKAPDVDTYLLTVMEDTRALLRKDKT